MQVGNVIQFKATGVIGTIIAKVERRNIDDAFTIWVHGADFPRTQTPTMFRVEHLEEVAEVVSS